MADDSLGKQRKGKPRGRPFKPGNATGFQPGQSGNPTGLPKGYQRMDKAIMREMVRDPNEPEQPPKTYYEKLARKIRDQGSDDGEAKQQDMLIRNNDGPPVQRVETDITVKRYAWGEGDPLGLEEEETDEEEG